MGGEDAAGRSGWRGTLRAAFLSQAGIEVAHRRDLHAAQLVQSVGGNGVVEARVAVDPDGVEPLFQGAGILLPVPLAGHDLGRVDDVAQPQHDAGAAGTQHRQHGVQLGQRAPRDVVDDEQPGCKGGERGQNGLGSQVDQFLQRQAQRTRAVAAIGLFLVGRQGDAVDPPGQRKCA